MLNQTTAQEPDMPASHIRLHDAYMLIYSDFAVSLSDIADSLDVNVSTARRLANKLIAANIVHPPEDVNDEAQGNRRRGQFKELLYQACPTYDDITPDEAEALFARTFPTEPAPKKRGAKLSDKHIVVGSDSTGNQKTSTPVALLANLTDAEYADLAAALRTEGKRRRAAARRSS